MTRGRSIIATFVSLLACASLALGASASPAPAAKAPASMSAAEPILKMIPAGTWGYVVVHNAQNACGDVDKFLKQAGLDVLLKDELPDGALKALLKTLELGDGLNPNGGVAIAMLDPNAFGIDPIKLMKSAISGGEKSSTAPAAAAGGFPQLPFVIFVSGTGVKEVFGRFDPKPAGPYMKLTLENIEFFAAPLGSYLLLSPNAKALEAVAKAPQKADDELKGRPGQIVRTSAVAAWVNVKAVAPVLQKAVKALDLLVSAQNEGLVDDAPEFVEIYSSLKPVIAGWLAQIAQVDEFAVGARLAATGVVAEVAVKYLPDTPLAKGLAAGVQAGRTPILDLLPGKGYLMAVAVSLGGDAASRELSARNLETLLDNPMLGKLQPEDRDKIKAVHKNLLEEVTDVGFVLSTPTGEGKGVLAAACVLKGKDAEKIKGLLADTTKVAADLIKSVAGEAGEAVKVSYDKGVDKVDGVSVDSIKIEVGGDAGVGLAMIAPMLFGEGGLSPRVASADKNTVVIALGGGSEALSEALKAAAGKQDKDQKLFALKDNAESLQFMPKNLETILLVDVSTYFDMMMRSTRAMMPDMAMPAAVTCKTPVALGSGREDSAAVVTFYLPTEVVKQVVAFIQAEQNMRGRGPGNPNAPGGDEF